MSMCFLASVKSPKGTRVKEQVFESKSDAINFKTKMEYDSDKKVKLKKVKC